MDEQPLSLTRVEDKLTAHYCALHRKQVVLRAVVAALSAVWLTAQALVVRATTTSAALAIGSASLALVFGLVLGASAVALAATGGELRAAELTLGLFDRIGRLSSKTGVLVGPLPRVGGSLYLGR